MVGYPKSLKTKGLENMLKIISQGYVNFRTLLNKLLRLVFVEKLLKVGRIVLAKNRMNADGISLEYRFNRIVN